MVTLIVKNNLFRSDPFAIFFRSSDHIQKKLKNYFDLIAGFKKIVICHFSGKKKAEEILHFSYCIFVIICLLGVGIEIEQNKCLNFVNI